VTIPLRDGTELQVGPEGVYLGERRFALDSIQDARQVAPDPETVALRVASSGMIEFQPARPGDGSVALEALYRLRPELRPAGFEPVQGLPPAFPTPPPPPPPYGAPGYPPFAAPYPPPYAMPPYAMPPYGAPPYGTPPGYPGGYAPPPPMAPAPLAYGYNPNAQRAELTPFPRNFGEILGAIFQLYFKHWGRWLLLGLCAGVLPALALGGVQVLVYVALGVNPLDGSFQPSSTLSTTSSNGISSTALFPFKLVSGDQLVLYGGLAAGALVLSWLLAAVQVGALANGARQALLGREVRVGKALGAGLRRFFPVLVASFLIGVLTLLCIAPGYTLLGISLVSLLSASSDSANLQAAQTGSLLACAGLAVVIPGAILLIFFSTRLGLAPYVAATERLGPLAALGKSWQLTRRSFWRVWGIILVMGFVVGIVGYAAGLVTVASVVGGLLVATPLLAAVTAPLTALTYTTLLYDLRLRHEGYAAVVAEDAPVETAPAPTV
jgi:hypothetical protein